MINLSECAVNKSRLWLWLIIIRDVNKARGHKAKAKAKAKARGHKAKAKAKARGHSGHKAKAKARGHKAKAKISRLKAKESSMYRTTLYFVIARKIFRFERKFLKKQIEKLIKF